MIHLIKLNLNLTGLKDLSGFFSPPKVIGIPAYPDSPLVEAIHTIIYKTNPLVE